MAGSGSTVKVSFLGDASALAKASKQAQSSIDGVGAKASRTGGALAGLGRTFIGAAAAVGAVSMFKDFIAEAQESRRVGNLTAQVIKTTGGAAKVTAAQVGQLATAISNKTGIDDEAIQSGANLLLTFTDIRNEVGKGNDIFNQATQTITDMSAALGQDTKTSAIQLGKALNDPVRGVTALQKVGVSFTEAQKKQIATFIKAGKTAEAQKVILHELGREFGGAAAAASTPSQKLGVAIGNLKESIGTALLPVVDKMATFLADRVIPAAYKLGGALRAVGGVVRIFVDAFRGKSEINEFDGVLKRINNAGVILGDGFRKLASWAQTSLFPALAKVGHFLASTFAPTARALGQYVRGTLVPGFQGLAQKVHDNLGPVLKLAGVIGFLAAKILGFLLPILIRLQGHLIGGLFKAIGIVITVIGALVRAVIGIGTGLGIAAFKVFEFGGKVVGFVKGLPGKVTAASRGLWDGIKDSFRSAVNWIITKWNDLSFTIGGGTILGKKLPSVTLSTPNIPTLANGGVVRARPGGILANIGEGRSDEAVVPLDRLDSLGGGRPIVVQLVLDSRVIHESLLNRRQLLGRGLGLA